MNTSNGNNGVVEKIQTRLKTFLKTINDDKKTQFPIQLRQSDIHGNGK